MPDSLLQTSLSLNMGPDGTVLVDCSATTSANDSALFMKVPLR